MTSNGYARKKVTSVTDHRYCQLAKWPMVTHSIKEKEKKYSASNACPMVTSGGNWLTVITFSKINQKWWPTTDCDGAHKKVVVSHDHRPTTIASGWAAGSVAVPTILSFLFFIFYFVFMFILYVLTLFFIQMYLFWLYVTWFFESN